MSAVDRLPSIWVHQETSAVEGLQRADELVDDTCGGSAGRSDTRVR